jgi:hypothetical protein
VFTWIFSMPNRRPNRWWLWWWRCAEKSNTINELPQSEVELAKTERADRTGPNWFFFWRAGRGRVAESSL